MDVTVGKNAFNFGEKGVAIFVGEESGLLQKRESSAGFTQVLPVF